MYGLRNSMLRDVTSIALLMAKSLRRKEKSADEGQSKLHQTSYLTFLDGSRALLSDSNGTGIRWNAHSVKAEADGSALGIEMAQKRAKELEME